MRAMYIGPNDDDRGLEHGRHYHIKREDLKSGRIRVTVEHPKGKVNYKDVFDFARNWQVK